MVEEQFSPECCGFIHKPLLEQMLLKNVAWFGQQLVFTTREDDSNAFHIQGLDMIRYLQIQVLYSKIRKALATMDWCSNFRIRLDHNGRKAKSRCMNCSRATTRPSPNYEEVASLRLCHGVYIDTRHMKSTVLLAEE